MKNILTSLLFVLIASATFSQNCIQKHIGVYKVDTDKTFDAIKKANPEKAKEEQPEGMAEMLNGISLTITEKGLSMTMMGRINEIDATVRETEKKGGSCDLLFNIPADQLPEGVEAPFLTIYVNESKQIMLKSSGGSNDMDFYVWTKVE